jgi:hypothetical protein
MTMFVLYSLIANTFLDGSLQDCVCVCVCVLFFFKKSHLWLLS